jgi:hypothetical protein
MEGKRWRYITKTRRNNFVLTKNLNNKPIIHIKMIDWNTFDFDKIITLLVLIAGIWFISWMRNKTNESFKVEIKGNKDNIIEKKPNSFSMKKTKK